VPKGGRQQMRDQQRAAIGQQSRALVKTNIAGGGAPFLHACADRRVFMDAVDRSKGDGRERVDRADHG
jgi:hypothetical protein